MKNVSLLACALFTILPAAMAQIVSAGVAKAPPQTQAPGAPPNTPVLPAPTEIKRNRTSASVSPDGTYYRASTAESIPPLVIQFSSTNQSMIQGWEEDLTVMTRLLEEALQRAADEDLTDVPIKFGIP